MGLGDGFVNKQSVFYAGNDEFSNIDAVQVALSTNTKGAIGFFAKPVDAIGAGQTTIMNFADFAGNTQIICENLTNGKVRWFANITGTLQWSIISDNAVLADNTWIHMGINMDAAPTLYFNGIAIAQTLTSGANDGAWFNSIPAINNGRIGDKNVNGAGEAFHWEGNIDEPHFFNASLTAPEWVELYNLGVGWDVRNHSKSANLVSGFHIDGDIVPNMIDYVGGHDGTYVNVTQAEIQNDVNG